MRAIYRLSIIGIIDDYVIDYRDRRVFLKFSSKSSENYKTNFENYLRRYLGKQSTDGWLKRVEGEVGETELRKYVYTLTRFFEETIVKKRLASAKYMDELCQHFIEEQDKTQAEKKFRNDIIYYFTSKYANELIDQIRDAEDNEHVQLFFDFLKKIEHPPEHEIGLELNNAKHILGACQRFNSQGQSNVIVDLLSSFCTLLLGGKVNGHLPGFIHSNIVGEQLKICLQSFATLLKKNNIDDAGYLKVLKKYTSLMRQLIPETTEVVNLIHRHASLHLVKNKLDQVVSIINT